MSTAKRFFLPYSIEELIRYLKGELSEEKTDEIYKYIQANPLYLDVLDGLERLEEIHKSSTAKTLEEIDLELDKLINVRSKTILEPKIEPAARTILESLEDPGAFCDHALCHENLSKLLTKVSKMTALMNDMIQIKMEMMEEIKEVKGQNEQLKKEVDEVNKKNQELTNLFKIEHRNYFNQELQEVVDHSAFLVPKPRNISRLNYGGFRAISRLRKRQNILHQLNQWHQLDNTLQIVFAADVLSLDLGKPNKFFLILARQLSKSSHSRDLSNIVGFIGILLQRCLGSVSAEMSDLSMENTNNDFRQDVTQKTDPDHKQLNLASGRELPLRTSVRAACASFFHHSRQHK